MYEIFDGPNCPYLTYWRSKPNVPCYIECEPLPFYFFFHLPKRHYTSLHYSGAPTAMKLICVYSSYQPKWMRKDLGGER